MSLKIAQIGNETFQPLITNNVTKYSPDLSIKVTEIPISTSVTNIRSSFTYFGEITRCVMTTKNLWQQATITFSEGTDMTELDNVNGYFVLKDMVRVHRCTLPNDKVWEKSKYSLKLTNLPIDTNGRHLIPIGHAVNALTFIIPKSRSNYRNLQYAVFYFRSQEDLDSAQNGDTLVLDGKRLIWTDPSSKLCFICSVPGHRSNNCRKARIIPKDHQTQNLYQRYQPAQFRSYTAPKKIVNKSISFAHVTKGVSSSSNNKNAQPPPMPPRPTNYRHQSNKEDTSLDASIHAKGLLGG